LIDTVIQVVLKEMEVDTPREYVINAKTQLYSRKILNFN
jgi:hypothetical protein